MKDLVAALGLLFFIEGLFFAIFPTRIKNMLKAIDKIPENKLRSMGLFFLILGIFNCLVREAINENDKKNIYYSFFTSIKFF
jgi:uncharacterized protein YjeT (DUF2065 family)